MAITIRTTTEHDWEQVRTLRLEALADTPLAFGEHLVDAEKHGESEWRMRGARGTNPHSVFLVAIDDDGRWVGTMAGYVDRSVPMLVGVYVSPSVRGTGVAEALLAGIEEWALTEGDMLLLHVHEENPRARAFYAKAGYIENGVTHPYVLDPSAREVEMVKLLR